MPGIAGLTAGMAFVRSVGAESILAHEKRLIAELGRALARDGRIECFAHPGQTGVLSVRVRGMAAEQAAEGLVARGVAVRAGLHCAPLAHPGRRTPAPCVFLSRFAPPRSRWSRPPRHFTKR